MHKRKRKVLDAIEPGQQICRTARMLDNRSGIILANLAKGFVEG
jgi:hypothetical protein